jgi:hypothetical protein
MLLQGHIVHFKSFYVRKAIINRLIYGQLDVFLLSLLGELYYFKVRIVWIN